MPPSVNFDFPSELDGLKKCHKEAIFASLRFSRTKQYHFLYKLRLFRQLWFLHTGFLKGEKGKNSYCDMLP